MIVLMFALFIVGHPAPVSMRHRETFATVGECKAAAVPLVARLASDASVNGVGFACLPAPPLTRRPVTPV